MNWTKSLVFIAICGALPAPARALCLYHGDLSRLDYRTTLAEEFRDSRWVVRARVLSARDHWSDVEESWTGYRLEVLETFKGRPPRQANRFGWIIWKDRPQRWPWIREDDVLDRCYVEDQGLNYRADAA